MRSTVVMALLLIFAQTPAKNRRWQDGTLAGVKKTNSRAEILEQEMQTGTGDKAIRYSVTFQYTIDTADKSYIADIDAVQMFSPVNASPIDIDTAANPAHVSFAVEKSKLYIKDKDGKEYKLAIVKQGPREAEPAKPQ